MRESLISPLVRKSFWKGLKKKKEKREKEIYPGYRPASGNKVFCANLEVIVRRTMIKKREIAEKIGVSPSYITKITTGKSKSSIEVALKIADAIGLDLSELITSEEIDSWLAERLSIFQRVGVKEMIRVLLPDAKRQLLEIFKVIEEKKEVAPNALSRRQFD